MVGGVAVNVLLAMVIYAMILFTWGDDYLKTENLKYGIECSDLAKEIGFENGDKILTIDGVYYENFSDIPEAILISGASEVLVDRNGETVSISIPSNIIEQFIEKNAQSGFIGVAWPYIAQKFDYGSVAEAAGVLAGDQLIAINGEESLYFSSDKCSGSLILPPLDSHQRPFNLVPRGNISSSIGRSISSLTAVLNFLKSYSGIS